MVLGDMNSSPHDCTEDMLTNELFSPTSGSTMDQGKVISPHSYIIIFIISSILGKEIIFLYTRSLILIPEGF